LVHVIFCTPDAITKSAIATMALALTGSRLHTRRAINDVFTPG